MYHSLSHVTSGGGAVYLLSVVGRIACQDAHLCEAFSCAWPPSATFSTRREIERLLQYQPLALRGERPHFASLRPRCSSRACLPGTVDACRTSGKDGMAPFAAPWAGPRVRPRAVIRQDPS